MRNSKPKLIARFGRHQAGAAAIEFAILSAPLIAIVLAALQTAIIFFADQALQTAAETAGRQLMTGADQHAGMTQSQFQSAVCAAAPTFTCGNIMVDVESASAYSNITTTTPTITYNANGAPTNTWNYSPGNGGDIVIVRVMYDWPVFGGPLSLNLANQSNGTYLLVATTVFKNEPFQ